MTKQESVYGILADQLEHYNISEGLLQHCAKEIVQDLDMWGEFSGDSVASSNRYQELEGQIEQLKKDKDKALDRQAMEYNNKLKDANASARAMINQRNKLIEELKKQIK